MEKVKQLARHLAHRVLNDAHAGSQLDIQRFERNPENPYLVSFPRTGSHWLRMLMELYFQRPGLVRTFYFPGRRDYMYLHTHDMDLQVQRSNVLYLYRDPVDTVYSQLNYGREPVDGRNQILHWTYRYACHLVKWLVMETNTTHKTVVRYERLKSDLSGEFRRVTGHFGLEYDDGRLEECAAQVARQDVSRKTQHDRRVVTLGQGYEDQREWFRGTQSRLIWDTMQQVFLSSCGNMTQLYDIFVEADMAKTLESQS